jgi:hypothetical protein
VFPRKRKEDQPIVWFVDNQIEKNHPVGMLCEKCQEREARVHKTFIDSSSETPERRVQHLCEICGGIKTEAELKEEQRARGEQAKIAREKDMEASRLAMEEIERGLFAERRQVWRSNKCGVWCWSIDNKWKFALTLVGSTSPDVDALELLFGPSGAGVNHVVRSVGGYEVHVIRWNGDPSRFLSHLFEVFPNGGGARLDMTTRNVSVDDAATLFPDPACGIAFCSRAINFLNYIPPRKAIQVPSKSALKRKSNLAKGECKCQDAKGAMSKGGVPHAFAKVTKLTVHYAYRRFPRLNKTQEAIATGAHLISAADIDGKCLVFNRNFPPQSLE